MAYGSACCGQEACCLKTWDEDDGVLIYRPLINEDVALVVDAPAGRSYADGIVDVSSFITGDEEDGGIEENEVFNELGNAELRGDRRLCGGREPSGIVGSREREAGANTAIDSKCCVYGRNANSLVNGDGVSVGINVREEDFLKSVRRPDGLD